MGTIFLVLLIVGTSSLLVWAVVAIQQRFHKQVDSSWSHVARQLEGKYHPEQGPWYNKKPPRIEAKLNDRLVEVELYLLSTGKSATYYTRLRCRATAPPDLAITVSHKSNFGLSRKLLPSPNASGAKMDSPNALKVKSTTTDLIPVWLRPEIHDLMLRTPRYRYSLRNEEVRAERTDFEKDPETLVHAMRAVALLAHRGGALLDEWREIAKALEGSITSTNETVMFDGSTVIHMAWHDIAIAIDLIRHRARGHGEKVVCTRVRGKRRGGERFVWGKEYLERPPENLEAVSNVDLALYSEDPMRTEKRFPESMQQELAALCPVEVTANDEEVVLVVQDVMNDAQSMTQAVEIVGKLCIEEEDSPYR